MNYDQEHCPVLGRHALRGHRGRDCLCRDEISCLIIAGAWKLMHFDHVLPRQLIATSFM